MFAKLARFVLAHRLLCGLCLLLVVGAVSAGGARLKPDMSLEAFFGGEAEADRAYASYRDYWGFDDAMVVVIARAEDGDVLTHARVNRLRELADELLDEKAVADVDNIATAIWMQSGGGALKLDSVADTMPEPEEGPEAHAAWRARLLADTPFAPALIAEDGSAAAMMVRLDGDVGDIAQVVPLVKGLRAALARHEGKDGLHFVEAGIPAVRTDFFDAFYQDQMVFFPITAALILLALGLTLRRLHGVIVPGVAAMLPLMMVMGVMGYVGQPLDIVSQLLLTLLPSLAVADAIHLVGRFHEEVRKRADPGQQIAAAVRREAITHALVAIGGACFLTSFTTAVGFGSLAMAKMPVLRHFGLFAALGVVLAYGSVLVIIPLLLSLTRSSVPDAGREGHYTPLDRFLLANARFATGRPRAVLLGGMILCLAFVWIGRGVVVDNNLTDQLGDAHRTTQANKLADERLGGILTLEIDVSGAPGALKQPKVLQALEALATFAEAQPGARMSISPATLVAEAHKQLIGGRLIPDAPNAVAQLLLMIEGNPRLKDLAGLDYARGRLVVRVQDHGARAFAALSEAVAGEMKRLFEGLPVEVAVTGTPFVAYSGINRVTFDLRDSLTLAFLVIGLALLILFRSGRLAFVALVPSVMPLVLGYGFLALVNWPLEPSSGLIFTIGLGIAIDDSVHVLARWREAHAGGASVHEAAIEAVLHSGRAVFLTSVLVTAAFGVYLFSSFPSMIVVGGLGAFLMLAALLCDALILPALLVLVIRD